MKVVDVLLVHSSARFKILEYCKYQFRWFWNIADRYWKISELVDSNVNFQKNISKEGLSLQVSLYILLDSNTSNYHE